MMKRFVNLLFFCLCVLSLSAQDTLRYDDRSGLSHWRVSDILQDGQGFIWLSTWNGLNRYDGYEFRQIKTHPGDGTSIQSEVVRQMTLDGDGNIICKTENGFFLFDTHSYTLHDLPADAGDTIAPLTQPATFTDRQGNLWHVERYGVTKVVRGHHPARVVEGTEELHARAFLLDNKQRWWVGTKEDECIRIYDRSNSLLGFLGGDGRLHHEHTSFGYRPYSIVQTRSGDIWIGCKPGALLRLRENNDGSYEIRHIGEQVVYHLVEDMEGHLWIATFGEGVQCVENPDEDRPDMVTFPDKVKVRRILVTPGGNLVCATTNGVLLGSIDQQDVSKSHFRLLQRDGKREGSLAGNATMDVAEDGQGRIFVATENNGIDMAESEDALFSPNPVFTHFSTVTSSLTTDVCLALRVKEDGRLFVVSNDCVMDFMPDSDATVTYAINFWNRESHFSEERPLLLPDSSWIFGQEQGAYIASRHSMESRGYTPPLHFTELNINGHRPDMGICQHDTIVIAPDERNFSISFVAIDYSDNASILYHYRMDGSSWSHASKERSLNFYDLRPGKYLLEVQSTDTYGRWVDNTRQLTIIVVPHWYETWWAKLMWWLLSLAFVAAVAYTVVYVRRLHRQRRNLLAQYLALLASNEEETKTESLPPADTQSQKAEPQALKELTEPDRRFMNRVMKYIEENISNSDANIDDMASAAATSRSNLNRKLRSLVGITAAQLLIDARMQQAKQMLEKQERTGDTNIADIAFRCGYSDSHYFSRCFKQKYGVSPSKYAKG